MLPDRVQPCLLLLSPISLMQASKKDSMLVDRVAQVPPNECLHILSQTPLSLKLDNMLCSRVKAGWGNVEGGAE